MNIKGIAKDTLDFILKVSESSAPNEFAGLLQEKDEIITEVLFIPGTESSEINAVIKLFMMPNVSSVGSVHSHPGPNIRPSDADRRLFGKTGSYHIIVGSPYDETNWQCYNADGEPIDLPVLDIELEEDELF